MADSVAKRLDQIQPKRIDKALAFTALSLTMKHLTLGHSPDPDDAFMFYALAKGLIDAGDYTFEHILQDIQTLNERATRGELDITAISIHAYAYVSDQYALLPSGASMGDGYGPMLVSKHILPKEVIADKKIAIPGEMTSAFLALQLWLEKPKEAINYVIVPFDKIFDAVNSGQADVGLVIHEGQLTFENEGLICCQDLGAWWGEENDGLPLPLGGNVIHKRIPAGERRIISDLLTQSIQYSLDHRPQAVTTHSSMRATWGRNWPTNLWACTSITGPLITGPMAGKPSADSSEPHMSRD